MKRQKRQAEKFGPLELFAAIARGRNLHLGNSDDVSQFGKIVLESLKASTEIPTLLHGKRTEMLFAFVAAGLGKCKMIKSEDAGEFFMKGNLQAPDYRIVLEDGTQLLVEVKNFYSVDIRKKFVLTREYYARLDEYAVLQGVQLKIAIYFSSVNRWTLLSAAAFEKTEKGLEINFLTALAKNEMLSLGDVHIATLPELRLEMMGDHKEASRIDEDGMASLIFRSGKIFCGGNEILVPLEQRIAFDLLQYGRWTHEMTPVVKDGKLLGVIFKSSSEEVFEGQPFAIVGELSSMISEAYTVHTVRDGKLVAIDAAIEPEVLALSIPHEYKSEQLPLWRFLIQPNHEWHDANIFSTPSPTQKNCGSH